MSQSLIPLENTLLNNEAFDAWLQYRKDINKPIPPPSIKFQENKLISLAKKEKRFDSMRAQELLVWQAMEGGWRGLYKLKDEFLIIHGLLEIKDKTQEKDFEELHTDSDWAKGLV